MARTPYGQSKEAVEFIRGLVDEMSRDIDSRLLDGEDGPVIDCLQSHRSTTFTLQELAEAERARLVEALADGDQPAVAVALRNVMLWQVKAKVTVDQAGECGASS